MQRPPVTALRQALLLGAALLMAPAFATPPAKAKPDSPPAAAKVAAKKAAQPTAVASKKAGTPKTADKKAVQTAAAKKPVAQKPGPLANFGKTEAPADVVQVANWVSYTHNSGKKAFVLIDKKQARLYVFEPGGKLKSDAPVLLGKAVGDQSVPGIGDKPLSQVKDNEKTTPAGRFLAIPGKNTHGDDIIWIDYKAAVSMHRMRKVSEEEHRAERMATPEVSDNRISNGCVNVPPDFYNKVLRPTVVKYGALVYVLPETTTPQQLFGAYDVAGKAASG